MTAIPRATVLRVPAKMRDIAEFRWSIEDIGPGKPVEMNLGSWRTVGAAGVVGLVCTMAYLGECGFQMRVRFPRDDFALRKLSAMGFVDAIATFATWQKTPPSGSVRSHYPIIKVHPVRSQEDVDAMAARLEREFQEQPRLWANQLGDVFTVLTEAAANVLEHSKSSVGGFAVAQMRYFKRDGVQRYYIEVSVGDPGIGIAASLNETDDATAIARALEERTTSTGQQTRGFGLSDIQEVARSGLQRSLIIHSGNGWVLRAPDVAAHSTTVGHRFNGTLLTVYIPC